MWVTPPSPSRIRVRSSSICSAARFSKETAPLAEEHRDDVELDLVEDAGRERQLRYPGAMDEHVLLACGLLGSIHRGRDVVNGSDQRPLPNVDTRLPPVEDEDRYAVVVVAAPAARRLEGSAASDDGCGGHELVPDGAVDPRWTGGDA